MICTYIYICKINTIRKGPNQEEHAHVIFGYMPVDEQIEEENYFFALSKFNDQIKQAIESNEFRIVPKGKRNEILSLLNEGLDDISISRSKEKLSWGVPVPNDESQVMYVWFEALLNYITVIGYPDSADFEKYWNFLKVYNLLRLLQSKKLRRKIVRPTMVLHHWTNELGLTHRYF